MDTIDWAQGQAGPDPEGHLTSREAEGELHPAEGRGESRALHMWF